MDLRQSNGTSGDKPLLAAPPRTEFIVINSLRLPPRQKQKEAARNQKNETKERTKMQNDTENRRGMQLTISA